MTKSEETTHPTLAPEPEALRPIRLPSAIEVAEELEHILKEVGRDSSQATQTAFGLSSKRKGMR